MSGNNTITSSSTSAQQDAHNINKPAINNVTSSSHGVDTRDFEENTPLIAAANEGQYEAAKTLLDKGAHPDSQNIYGYTPLLSAVAKGHLSLAKLLVERGANVHLATLEGESALHFTVIRGDESLVSLLVKNGAFLNVQDNEGDTPLHWAIREQAYPMLNFLLQQKGCNPSVANEDGETPLHLAASLGEDLPVACLLKHGANATMKDIEGLTPLDVALETGESKVIELLGKLKRALPPRGAHSPRRCATSFNSYERIGFLSPLPPASSSPFLSLQEPGSSF